MEQISEFKTYDVDLSAFLMQEGLEYIGSELDSSKPHKVRVILRFSDPLGKARDLERVFISSQQKSYRDCHRFLLKEVHKTLNENEG